MKLAWRELIRRPSRFLTAGMALTLIVLLLLVLGGILDALIQSSTGLLKAQSAPLIVVQRRQQGLDRPLARHRGGSTTRSPRCPACTRPPDWAWRSWPATSMVARSPPTSPCSATRPRTGSFPRPRRRAQGYADRSLAERRARGRRHDRARHGAHAGRGDRLGVRYRLQPAERAVGRRRHLARGAERQHPGCRGRPGHLPGDPRDARGRRDARRIWPRRSTAAVPTVTTLTIDEAIAGVPGVCGAAERVHVDHRHDVRRCGDRRGAVLRAAHDRADRACSGVLKAIGASSRTLAAGLTLAGAADRRRRLGAGRACWPSVLAQVIPDAVPLDAVRRAGSRSRPSGSSVIRA